MPTEETAMDVYVHVRSQASVRSTKGRLGLRLSESCLFFPKMTPGVAEAFYCETFSHEATTINEHVPRQPALRLIDLTAPSPR
jgi:hypothetical protein